MTDKLDLSLPQRQVPSSRTIPAALIIINLIVLALVCAMLAVMLISWRHPSPGTENAGLSAEAKKQLALKFETQGLTETAAGAWKEYLSQTRPGNEEAARVWFRIGKLYQDAHQYEQALSGYYRSEQFATVKDISTDIAGRVQECLESMGKFAALRDELDNRVKIKENNPGDPQAPGRETVAAEIGSEKITLSDLDHEIEKAIDRQMARMAPDLPEDIRNQQKEKLLKQFSTGPQRQQFLGQYLAAEMLYREARETGLSQDPEIQSQIKDQEKSLLADAEVQRAYADNIKITDGDLHTYYEAHPEKFKTEDKQKPFDEVKNEVYAAIRSDKEKEIRDALFNHLKDKYNVVIHSSTLSPADAETGKQDTPSK